MWQENQRRLTRRLALDAEDLNAAACIDVKRSLESIDIGEAVGFGRRHCTIPYVSFYGISAISPLSLDSVLLSPVALPMASFTAPFACFALPLTRSLL